MFVQTCIRFYGHDTGQYRRALENVVRDLEPDGNIRADRGLLDGGCCASTSFQELERLIQDHMSHRPRSGKVGVTATAGVQYIRIMPHDEFKLHNHSDGMTPAPDRSPSTGGRNSIARGRTGNQGRFTRTFKPGTLRGGSGSPTGVTWWTFGIALMNQGADYFDSLALPEEKRPDARNGMIELVIDGAHFPDDVLMHKPTAFDGFCANSKFEPDFQNTDHGMTRPDTPRPGGGPPLAPCPEVVSCCLRYDRLTAPVHVRFLPY